MLVVLVGAKDDDDGLGEPRCEVVVGDVVGVYMGMKLFLFIVKGVGRVLGDGLVVELLVLTSEAEGPIVVVGVELDAPSCRMLVLEGEGDCCRFVGAIVGVTVEVVEIIDGTSSVGKLVVVREGAVVAPAAATGQAVLPKTRAVGQGSHSNDDDEVSAIIADDDSSDEEG